MSDLKTTFGNFVFGTFIFHGTRGEGLPPVPIEPPIQDGIDIYNAGGALIWSFNVSNEHSPVVDFSLTEKFIGGLDSFKFALERNFEIPFFSKMNARLYHNRTLYAQGEVSYIPDPAEQNKMTFEGSGYGKQYKEVTIDKSYTSEYSRNFT